jgi:hypothetical protein
VKKNGRSKKAAGWVVANYMEQDWEVTPVKVAVKDFLKRKKDGGAKTNCLTNKSRRSGCQCQCGKVSGHHAPSNDGGS